MGNHKDPQSCIFYTTAEDFTNDMISSLKQNRIEDFKRRYRSSCDVLLLEGIHFLAERLQRDVRQMESALKCLKARAELMGVRIDLPAGREVVSALVAGESCLGPRHVKELVCGSYKVDPHMLASKSRKKV
ncbi:MAG: DnaA ATPase domain-containing protein [Desulfobacteraceae bacterium]